MIPEVSREEIIDSMARQLLGIHLSEVQIKFIKAIKGREVEFSVSKENRNTKEFQELADLLADLHKRGLLSNFKIIET